MPVGAAPDTQMQSELGMRSGNFNPLAWFCMAHGATDQKIAAGFQPQCFKVNAQREIRPGN